jgi:hypothetical protein
MDSGEHLGQRGLAAAVLSDQCVNLPYAEGDRDVAEGLDAGEGL